MFEPDRQTHQPFADAELGALRRIRAGQRELITRMVAALGETS